jgi:hypothetical protein
MPQLVRNGAIQHDCCTLWTLFRNPSFTFLHDKHIWILIQYTFYIFSTYLIFYIDIAVIYTQHGNLHATKINFTILIINHRTLVYPPNSLLEHLVTESPVPGTSYCVCSPPQ